ncbi:hypothetical protein O3P69_000249 [Scylla paramamosain]|uniref:CUB domain-containing protein n=1 Tax=Scylla paramamosain TaxID=85552 RepID=A0AAW0UXY3_SCYPA
MVRHRPSRGPWAFRQTCPVSSLLPLLLLLLLVPCASKAQQQYQDDVVFYKKSDDGILKCVAHLQYSLSPEPSGSLENLECQLASDMTRSTSSSASFNCDQVYPAPWWPESWDNKIGDCRQQLSFSSSTSSSTSSFFTSSLSSPTNSRTSSFNEPSGSSSDTSSSSTLDCICEGSGSTSSGENLLSSGSSDVMLRSSYGNSSSQLSSISASYPAVPSPSFSSQSLSTYAFLSSSSESSSSLSVSPSSKLSRSSNPRSSFKASTSSSVSSPSTEASSISSAISSVISTSSPPTSTTTTTPTTTTTTTTTTTMTTESPSICAEVLLTEDNVLATVTSPGYPELYPNDYHCEFNVTAPEGWKVVLIFESLKVQYTKRCTDDYVRLVQLDKYHGVQFCGNKLPPPWMDFISFDNFITATFHTGPTRRFKGFKFIATAIKL